MDKGQNLQAGNKNEVIDIPESLTAARITGCKNLIPVDVLGTEDGQYTLKSNQLNFKGIKRNNEVSGQMIAGIRSHHLSLYPLDREFENTFECEVIKEIEGVFSYTVIVNCMGCVLEVEVEKASYNSTVGARGKKMKLHIPPDKIFLMN